VSPTNGSGDGSVTVTTNSANTSLSTRSATVTFSASGVSSSSVTVTQSGTTPTLSVSPSIQSVSSASGITNFTITSDIDWAVNESSDWLSAVKSSATILTVNYNQNSSVASRSVNITITGTGVASQVVTINQAGSTPSLIVTPLTNSVSSVSGTTIFNVSSNIDWTVNESSDWLTVEKTNPTTLTVIYNQNLSQESRLASITISGTGVISQVISIVQDKENGTSVVDIFTASKITIYPNPTSDNLYIESYSNIYSEILIQIFDNSGHLFCSKFVEGLIEGEQIEVKIHTLKSGIYFLQLSSNKSTRIEKIIKK